MRSLTRFGVAVAATAFASATAFAGAGAAMAQDLPSTGSVAGDNFTMSSKSTLSAQRTATGISVVYTNNTARSLVCGGVSAPANVITAFDAHVKKHGERSLASEPSAELQAAMAKFEADPSMQNKVFSLGPGGDVTGSDLDSTVIPGGEDPVVAPGKSLTWKVPAPSGYDAAAMVLCMQLNEDATGPEEVFSYAEYLSTTSGGGSGSLGSDGSGSLGSLGSLGS